MTQTCTFSGYNYGDIYKYSLYSETRLLLST